ncbi:hypothetical protein KI387_025155, partial [Taxus chinensis]
MSVHGERNEKKFSMRNGKHNENALRMEVLEDEKKSRDGFGVNNGKDNDVLGSRRNEEERMSQVEKKNDDETWENTKERNHVTPLSGVHSETPLCYLLSIDGFNILVDCGWNDFFDTEQLHPLTRPADMGTVHTRFGYIDGLAGIRVSMKKCTQVGPRTYPGTFCCTLTGSAAYPQTKAEKSSDKKNSEVRYGTRDKLVLDKDGMAERVECLGA